MKTQERPSNNATEKFKDIFYRLLKEGRIDLSKLSKIEQSIGG